MDKFNFKEYCEKHEYSIYQTRSQAFQLGRISRQAEVDELERKLKFSEASRNNQFEHLQTISEQRDSAQQMVREHKTEIDEKNKRIGDQKDFIEMALNSLNHLKENAVTHRDYGHECNWTRSFNDLIKLADDAVDTLKEALRGGDE